MPELIEYESLGHQFHLTSTEISEDKDKDRQRRSLARREADKREAKQSVSDWNIVLRDRRRRPIPNPTAMEPSRTDLKSAKPHPWTQELDVHTNPKPLSPPGTEEWPPLFLSPKKSNESAKISRSDPVKTSDRKKDAKNHQDHSLEKEKEDKEKESQDPSGKTNTKTLHDPKETAHEPKTTPTPRRNVHLGPGLDKHDPPPTSPQVEDDKSTTAEKELATPDKAGTTKKRKQRPPTSTSASPEQSKQCVEADKAEVELSGDSQLQVTENDDNEDEEDQVQEQPMVEGDGTEAECPAEVDLSQDSQLPATQPRENEDVKGNDKDQVSRMGDERPLTQ